MIAFLAVFVGGVLAAVGAAVFVGVSDALTQIQAGAQTLNGLGAVLMMAAQEIGAADVLTDVKYLEGARVAAIAVAVFGGIWVLYGLVRAARQPARAKG